MLLHTAPPECPITQFHFPSFEKFLFRNLVKLHQSTWKAENLKLHASLGLLYLPVSQFTTSSSGTVQDQQKFHSQHPAMIDFYSGTCSLSLWRVVRGSKLMHLDLIHGLFIT
jgi:hypothetical protein